jgi:hypothetical protein
VLVEETVNRVHPQTGPAFMTLMGPLVDVVENHYTWDAPISEQSHQALMADRTALLSELNLAVYLHHRWFLSTPDAKTKTLAHSDMAEIAFEHRVLLINTTELFRQWVATRGSWKIGSGYGLSISKSHGKTSKEHVTYMPEVSTSSKRMHRRLELSVCQDETLILSMQEARYDDAHKGFEQAQVETTLQLTYERERDKIKQLKLVNSDCLFKSAGMPAFRFKNRVR